jgi:hypothetical protein
VRCSGTYNPQAAVERWRSRAQLCCACELCTHPSQVLLLANARAALPTFAEACVTAARSSIICPAFQLWHMCRGAHKSVTVEAICDCERCEGAHRHNAACQASISRRIMPWLCFNTYTTGWRGPTSSPAPVLSAHAFLILLVAQVRAPHRSPCLTHASSRPKGR